MTEEVILVDEQDNAIGTMQKMEAHELGKLHRAFSVFVFNSRGELLLQQRALDKYHSGGKWTNTCCSHPRSGEDTIDAANRRLMEEMGLNTSLEHVFSFMYHAPVNERLSENEFDHVFFGVSDALPEPDADEVADYRYVMMDELAADLTDHPDRYTEWLKICFNRVTDHYRKYF
ncbi:isopentenyl-diphosphate Delta-isomerase [Pedobacter faecalis]|uniref:isopentenyl-diphosphate Delta-isomerase n=1 Tax=Pedobacter faecalis TaxID=3041495 RepID=UPI00254A937A|nr:isopentenyl-diphosphate Delta-isomerase [Pedobacter sp. ELA7]